MSTSRPLADLVKEALQKSSKVSDEVIQEIKKAPITDVLPLLAEDLTSEDDKRMNIAANVVFQASKGRKDVDEVGLRTLLEFFAGLSREYATSDVGTTAVCTLANEYASLVTPEMAVEVLLRLFLSHAHAQAMVLTTKRQVFALLNTFLTNDSWREAAIEVGSEFARTFVTQVDGERDPELVLKMLDMTYDLAEKFPAKALAFLKEELFDMASAYFPVLFTPPPNCSVTRADLRKSLHKTMIVPLFNEICIPFLCSKLTSPAASAKSDSCEVLVAAVKAIDEGFFMEHVNELLVVTRGEVLKITAMMESNPDLAGLMQLLMDVLAAVANRLAKAPTAAITVLSPIVDSAIQQVEMETSVGRTYATMLYAVASADHAVCLQLAKYVLPSMLQLGEAAKTNRRFIGVVSCLGAIVTAAEGICGKTNECGALDQFPESVAVSTAKFLMETMRSDSDAVTEYVVRVCIEASATIIALGKHAKWVPRDVQTEMYRAILTVAISDVAPLPTEDVRNSAIKALANVSRVDGANARANVKDLLSDKFFADCDVTSLTAVVEGIVESCAGDDDVTTWALDVLLGPNGFPVEKAALTLAATVAETKKAEVQPVAEKWINALWTVSGTSQCNDDAFDALLCASGALCAALPAPLQTEQLQSAVSTTLTPSPVDPAAFAAENNSAQLCRAHAFASVVIATVDGAAYDNLGDKQMGELAAVFVARAVTSANVVPTIRRTALDVVSSLANKGGASLFDSVDISTLNVAVAAAAARGFLVRGNDEVGSRFLRRLLDCLRTTQSDRESEELSEAFGNLVAKARGLKTAMMWQQRSFHTIMSKLAEVGKDTGAPMKARALAFASIAMMITNVPEKVVKVASEQLLPLAGEALKAGVATLAPGATMVANLFKSDEDAVVTWILETPELMLALASAGCQAQLPLAARKGALEVIGHIGQMATHDEDLGLLATPLKGDIVKTVRPALEDKKRLVRTAAARCRHYWSLIE